jgi:hypothetical protein
LNAQFIVGVRLTALKFVDWKSTLVPAIPAGRQSLPREVDYKFN